MFKIYKWGTVSTQCRPISLIVSTPLWSSSRRRSGIWEMPMLKWISFSLIKQRIWKSWWASMSKLLIQNWTWRTSGTRAVEESYQRWGQIISTAEGRCRASNINNYNTNCSIKTLAVRDFQGQEITVLQAIKAKSKSRFSSPARVLQRISIRRQLDSAISIKSVEMLTAQTQRLTK